MIIDVRRQALDGLEQRLHALELSAERLELSTECRAVVLELEHGANALVVDEGPNGLDVARCAENAAHGEDEDRHAALLITWRYAW